MRGGAAKFNLNTPTIHLSASMGTIVIGIIAVLLLGYLFIAMIFPEHF